MADKIVFNDPELGEVTDDETIEEKIKEAQEALEPLVQKVSSGVEIDTLRKFKDAVDRGDKKLAQKCIDEAKDEDIKAAMQRLFDYL